MTHLRSMVGASTAAALVLLLASGCGSDDPPTSSATTSETASATPSETAAPSPTPGCPNPEGRECLGALDAGTYTTQLFTPQLSYTVPAGWSNFEDMPGNFLLVPPDGTLAGVNAATSDFIGAYTSVVAIEGCESTVRTDVDTPAAFAAWLGENAGFEIQNEGPASVGGLDGVVADLRMSEGWTQTCPYSFGVPVVPMMAGSAPSGLDHNVGPGQVTRLYLLAYLDHILGIEVVDIADAGHLDAFTLVVESFAFGG